MLAEDDNTSDYFMHQKEEEYPLGNKRQDVEENQKNLVGKSSDNKIVKNIQSGHTPQNGLLGSESLSSLREVRFSK